MRARPQRNAYHRFTVDRHSLEAVVECAALLDPDDPAGAGFDGVAARARRGATCCCSARCSTTSPRANRATTPWWGRRSRREVATRIGVDAAGADDLAWVVRNHLLLADTATRRDLGDERTITRYADEVRDAAAQRVALRAHDRRLARHRACRVEHEQGGAGPRPCSPRPTPDSVPPRSSTTGPTRTTRCASLIGEARRARVPRRHARRRTRVRSHPSSSRTIRRS